MLSESLFIKLTPQMLQGLKERHRHYMINHQVTISLQEYLRHIMQSHINQGQDDSTSSPTAQ